MIDLSFLVFHDALYYKLVREWPILVGLYTVVGLYTMGSFIRVQSFGRTFSRFSRKLSFLTITCYFVLIFGDQWAFVWEEGVIFRFYSLVRS